MNGIRGMDLRYGLSGDDIINKHGIVEGGDFLGVLD